MLKLIRYHLPPFCKTCFSTSESFWHAKNNLVSRHQEVGLGQTPPPVWEFFPHNPVFFSDSDPNTQWWINRDHLVWRLTMSYFVIFLKPGDHKFNRLSEKPWKKPGDRLIVTSGDCSCLPPLLPPLLGSLWPHSWLFICEYSSVWHF